MLDELLDLTATELGSGDALYAQDSVDGGACSCSCSWTLSCSI
jgi:hypothetical protein